MKIVTVILISLLTLPILGRPPVSIPSKGVYVQDSKTTEINFEIPHAYYSVKPTNTSGVLYFSNGLSSKVETNSELIVNTFVQDILNTNNYPEKAKFGPCMLNLSLINGNAYFVYPEENTNSAMVVSTSLADIELHKGAFYFVVNENSVLVLVIDGSLTAYGDKQEKRNISAGNTLVAIPNNVRFLNTKISLSTQFIDNTTLDKLKESIKEISNFKDRILFIRINEKTVGVSL